MPSTEMQIMHALGEQFIVSRETNRATARYGEPIEAPIIKYWWLPHVGPTALWLLVLLDQQSEGDIVQLSDLAVSLGLGHRQLGAAHHPIIRAFFRLQRFSLIEITNRTVIVPTAVHAPSLHQQKRWGRLSVRAHAEHMKV